MPLAVKKAKKAEPETVINFPQKYYVIGADLGLKRPGFCKLTVEKTDNETRLTDIKLLSIDNKDDRKKCHGQLIDEIMKEFTAFIPEEQDIPCFFVREHEISKQKNMGERYISKVIGMMDWLIYRLNTFWDDSLYPVTIKATVAGSGKATKEDVANALPLYVGNITFANDDESDATAVAITWLIKHHQIESKAVK